MNFDDLVKQSFDYDPVTGDVSWKIGNKRVKAGHVLRTMDDLGYYKVYLNKKRIQVHRLAWFLHYGYWAGIIDHINRCKTDNRINNLREVSRRENAENKDLKRSDSKQKYTGIEELPSGKFRARIVVQGKRKSLGTYKTAEEAHEAFINAKQTFHLYSK